MYNKQAAGIKLCRLFVMFRFLFESYCKSYSEDQDCRNCLNVYINFIANAKAFSFPYEIQLKT